MGTRNEKRKVKNNTKLKYKEIRVSKDKTLSVGVAVSYGGEAAEAEATGS